MGSVRKKFWVLSCVAPLLGLVWAASANAVPAFARKYDVNCNTCHRAYPELNAAGRQFKELGYRFPAGSSFEEDVVQEISDFLQLEEHVPVSMILVARPYDKKDSGQEKIRALHEVEIIGAGVLGEQWSGYFEIEAEDETGFELELAPAVLTWNYSKEFNLQFVWGPTFWADPYGIVGDHFRLTRGHVGAIDQRFGGADDGGRFRSTRQNVGAYGRVADRFFYNVNLSGLAEDAEGENASSFSGLVAYDLTDNMMIGALAISGEDEDQNRDFSRMGLQFQADVGDARLQALYITATDDRAAGDPRGPGEDDNTAFSLQASYVFVNNVLRPTWVPLIRYDSYETNDGTNTFDELTLNLTYYITQNIKAYVEYWDRFDAPTSAQEDSRITLQFVAGF